MIYVDGCFMIMMTNPHTQTDSTRTWPYREGETRADEWMDGDGLIFKKKKLNLKNAVFNSKRRKKS